MLDQIWNRKLARLPGEGVLLVCTDLHGNLRDFERMVALYREESALGPCVLAFCGDLVHGPPPQLNEVGAWPRHLGTPYVDQSVEVLLQFEALIATERIFSLMGNHEHAHIGGPVVPKFYPDEAAALNEALGDHTARMCDLFRSFPLVAAAPNGIVLTHAAPRQTAPTPEAFEALSWEGYKGFHVLEMADHDVVGALLWARGAEDHQARALLEVVTSSPEGVVVHGHDVVRSGHLAEGDHQLALSTSFALLDAHKTYLRIPLDQAVRTTADLREGVELRHLYGEEIVVGETYGGSLVQGGTVHPKSR